MSALPLLAREVRAEARSKDALAAMLLVALLVATVGVVAFRDAAGAPETAAAVLALALAFATSLGAARSFLAERDRGSFDHLLALPVARGSLYLSKAATNALVALAVAAVAAPAYLAVAGGLPSAPAAAGLALVLALAAIGLAAVATFLAALAAEARAREALVPVLLAPLAVPILMATVSGATDALAGRPLAAVRGEILFLAGADVALVAAAVLLFESVTE